MHRHVAAPLAAVLLALLAVVLYPALFLGSRVAPEASLRGTPPWREQWGPHPPPQASALRVARFLAPRLATISREGLACALWNPYIGGGRAGWMASPAEGGAPLTILTGLLARRAWVFTALVATVLTVAFLSTVALLLRLGSTMPAALVAGLLYALSGAVSTALLHPSGSALALGPLVLFAALPRSSSRSIDVAVWATVLALLGWSGAAALPFLAMALALVLAHRSRQLPASFATLLLAGALAAATVAPRWWTSSVSGEPGAPRPRPEISQPLTSPAAFLTEDLTQLEASAIAVEIPALSSSQAAYLGVPAALLSLLGLSRLRRRVDVLWPAFAVAGLWFAFAPSQVVAGLGLSQRPFAALALAMSVLAAFGCDRLLSAVASPRGRALVAVAIAIAVGTRLLPAAARQIPFAASGGNELPSPLPTQACQDGSRLVGLLDTMPPDAGATLGLRDARAADLRAEPAYAQLLGAGPGGLLTITDALRPALARLGVRWILEPLPLRVVSGEVFAAVDLRTATRVASAADWAEYRVVDPGGTLRLGLPSDILADSLVFEQRGPHHLARLPEDTTLAGETSAWRWWSLTPAAEERLLVLRIAHPAKEAPSRIEVALDRSHLSLVGESLGARVWRRDDAEPLAAALPPGSATVRLVDVTPQRVSVQIDASQDTTVRLLLKHRPGLHRATMDGVDLELFPAETVWSAARVPRGAHRLVVESRIPWAIKMLFVLGVVLVAGAWSLGRKR